MENICCVRVPCCGGRPTSEPVSVGVCTKTIQKDSQCTHVEQAKIRTALVELEDQVQISVRINRRHVFYFFKEQEAILLSLY